MVGWVGVVNARLREAFLTTVRNHMSFLWFWLRAGHRCVWKDGNSARTCFELSLVRGWELRLEISYIWVVVFSSPYNGESNGQHMEHEVEIGVRV